jgi:transcriptional regulator with XRE-family HTH domain
MALEAIIGANIRWLRKDADLSQEALAAKVGIDMRYLGGIERGQENPTVAVLAGIAGALGVPPSVLMVKPPK